MLAVAEACAKASAATSAKPSMAPRTSALLAREGRAGVVSDRARAGAGPRGPGNGRTCIHEGSSAARCNRRSRCEELPQLPWAQARIELMQQGDEPADMGGRERRASDETPLVRGGRSRDVAPGRDQSARRHIVPVIAGNGKHSEVRCREATAGSLRVNGADNDDASARGRIEQPLEQPVARAAEAQIDDLSLAVERELQRL